MGLTIRDKADTLATFRFISVQLMETLARWVPTTPELEVKTLFGRHIWDLAQHADALGKRTFELRAALHYSRRPVAEYWRVLESLMGATGTAERISSMYDAMLPDLESRYRRYLMDADRLLDEPSVRVIERILVDVPRMAADRVALVHERPDLAGAPTTPGRDSAGALRAMAQFVDLRPAVDGAAATEAS